MPLLAREHTTIPNKDILSWIFDEPKVDQDLPIYINANDPTNSITAAQAKILIRQLIAGFKHAGLNRGDTVLIHSFNNIYYPILVLSIIGFGAGFCGTNPSYTASELIYAIRNCQAKVVLCDPEVLGESITTAAKDCGLASSQILILDSTPLASTSVPSVQGFSSWRTLLNHGGADWFRFDDEETSKNTDAFLFFSSGTTGLPKLTRLSHYNLIAEHVLVFECHPRPYKITRLVALPLFHAATAPSTHISALKAGHVQFIERRYNPSTFLQLVEKYKITDLMLVPPQVTSLLAHPIPAARKQAMLNTVQQIWGGGAPLDAATQNALSNLLPASTPFTQIWAMTETSCIASFLPYPVKDDTGSVGRFLPNIDVKLLDDNGIDITASGGPGEIAIRGPTITRGYVGVPRKRDFDDQGYFRTGDILRCDLHTGLWYVVDRKKELIKVRGFQVAPAELEGMLLEHPGVADVAVIGVRNADGNSEMPRAYVVRAQSEEGSRLTEESVVAWMEGKLAKYKRLDGGVRFVESIPKTPSGKILKRVLRDRVEREIGAKL